MRHLDDTTADRPGSRPRDPAARQASGRSGLPGSEPAGQSGIGRPGDDQAGVAQSGPGRAQVAQSGASQAGVGQSGAGTVSKGPIWGFPPAPGQPPPLYPPGQFAAWNRLSPGGPAAGGQAPATAPGGARPAGDRGQPGQAWYGDGGPGSPDYEPGYSALAVSDPAADVTSTQTWQAIGDGAGATAGAWTNPRGGPGAPRAAGPAGATPALGRPALDNTAPGSTGTDSPATVSTGTDGPATVSLAAARTAAPGADPEADRGRTEPGPRSRAHGSRMAARGGGSRSSRSSRRRRGPSSAVLAVCAVVLLAVASGVFLFVTGRHLNSASPPATHPSAGTSGGSPTATASAAAGSADHIQTRAGDPLPLTVAQLFPPSFSAGGAAYVRTASRAGKVCASALVGTKLQSAVQSAKCDQVVRASYMSAAAKMMGTIGVLNLSTASAADAAGRAAGASDYIALLRAAKGPTHKLGEGTGVEEAEVKGHYLILVWAQFTGRHKPKTATQRGYLTGFMSNLFAETANVSLSSRMVNGQP
jgi:hypothetical protein